MKEVLIFGGTTEGRLLAEQLLTAQRQVHICVATEYGEEVLPKQEHLIIDQGRKNCQKIEELLLKNDWEMIVDATHPYAVEVSSNIKKACENTKREVVRLLRAAGKEASQNHVIYVDSIEEAIRYLNETTGNILFTTGSKDLPEYVAKIADISRIYVRILADGATVDQCRQMGLLGKQIICMQGPFSAALNAEMIKQVQAAYLVTKDTGATGGFPEKLEGAALAGARALVIRRPVCEYGVSMDEILQRLGIEKQPESRKVTLLGIGMGSLNDLTLEGKAACEEAEVILGASRMTEALQCFGKETKAIYTPEAIVSYLQEHPEKKRIVIAFSGDVGFYSGTKKLLAVLETMDVSMELLPGISSVVSFASKLHISWDDMKLVSIHGRQQNLLAAVKANEKVFSLAGYAQSIRELAKLMMDYGLSHVKISVGCSLNYQEESITQGTPKELLSFSKEGLCVVVIENDRAKDHVITHGLPDESFVRGNAPMTKEEIRSVSLSKLALTKDAVVYDVGAGTGSVGLECALQAVDGMVYAIEKKEDALALLAENQKKMGVSNFRIAAGTAPEAMEDLPAPTHAFVGGSSGNLKEILQVLLEKNPKVRIVINCIALETIAEVTRILTEMKFMQQEIVQLFVGKSKTLGNYHMMMGQNPVFIVTLQGMTDENA